MPRLSTWWLACFIIAVFANGEAGRAAGSEAGTASGSIVTNGSVVVQLRLVNPAAALDIEAQADRIRIPAAQPRFKGSDPTSAERTQLATDPFFAPLYERNPSDALRLLRQANYELAQARRR